jgi:hypothetical protein
MSLKGWGLLACIIAIVSLSTSGSSLGPVYRERPLPDAGGTMSEAVPAMTMTMISTEAVVFSSALRDSSKDNTVILINSEPTGSGSGDLSRGEDSLTSLPESGSGILLGFGVLAVIPLASRFRTFSRQ